MRRYSYSYPSPRGAMVGFGLRRHLLTSLAACSLVLAPVGLASCSGGDDTASTPTPTAPATPTSTPTPTPTSTAPPRPENTYPFDKPVEPPERYEHTQEGAVKTAEYFIELLGYMMSTGDTVAFEKIISEECEYCAHRIANAKEYNEGAAWVSGLEMRTHRLTTIFEAPDPLPGDWALVFDATISDYDFYTPEDGGIGTDPARVLEIGIVTKWDGSHWNITQADGRPKQNG